MFLNKYNRKAVFVMLCNNLYQNRVLKLYFYTILEFSIMFYIQKN